MEEIGVVLVLLWAFAVGYFAVDRFGRSMEKTLRAAYNRKGAAFECRDQKDTKKNTDDWMYYSDKQ